MSVRMIRCEEARWCQDSHGGNWLRLPICRGLCASAPPSHFCGQLPFVHLTRTSVTGTPVTLLDSTVMPRRFIDCKSLIHPKRRAIQCLIVGMKQSCTVLGPRQNTIAVNIARFTSPIVARTLLDFGGRPSDCSGYRNGASLPK